ncbi:hypothetical protein CLV30_10931 [Haloactinopolyspora alba]|uniref:DUF2510 domain-containing protein n=1 Tax=Haloactinopolyspora alba TaxID=648780 RepID=A0A2P8DZS6_9ACTN|nr:hypothetical protein [Haloactinopolyspora alba]PSL02725.1 hypothetical protein CLV30_10931 [Haloactinopolyspora alba]
MRALENNWGWWLFMVGLVATGAYLGLESRSGDDEASAAAEAVAGAAGSLGLLTTIVGVADAFSNRHAASGASSPEEPVGTWYPDPYGWAELRYHDGTRWTAWTWSAAHTTTWPELR